MNKALHLKDHFFCLTRLSNQTTLYIRPLFLETLDDAEVPSVMFVTVLNNISKQQL